MAPLRTATLGVLLRTERRQRLEGSVSGVQAVRGRLSLGGEGLLTVSEATQDRRGGSSTVDFHSSHVAVFELPSVQHTSTGGVWRTFGLLLGGIVQCSSGIGLAFPSTRTWPSCTRPVRWVTWRPCADLSKMAQMSTERGTALSGRSSQQR